MSGIRSTSIRNNRTLACLTVSFVLVLLTGPAVAIVANPKPFHLTQPDGYRFKAVARGDEWSSHIETIEGYTVQKSNAIGYWVYCDQDRSGELIETGLVVGRDDPAYHRIPKHLRSPKSARPSMAGTGGSSYTVSGGGWTGDHPVLVILVKFKNRSPIGATGQYFENIFFLNGRCVKDYYDEVSNGELDLKPAHEDHPGSSNNNGIVGWLPLDIEHPDPPSKKPKKEEIKADQDIVRRAVQAADIFVDFSLYDTKEPYGFISSDELSIVVVAAGYEAAYSNDPITFNPSVWANRGAFTFADDPPMVTDMSNKINKRIEVSVYEKGGGYILVGEWHQSNNSVSNDGHPATFGVIAHELGHELGLPDLYDYDIDPINGHSFGIGIWGLMGYGGWGVESGHLGTCPTHFCAWSKERLGYDFIRPIYRDETINIEPACTLGSMEKIYRINTTDPDQYFLVENRQLEGYDKGLAANLFKNGGGVHGGGGLAVWHIDAAMTNNNIETRKMVDLEEAEDYPFKPSELDHVVNFGDREDLFFEGMMNQLPVYPSPGSNLYDKNNSYSQTYESGIHIGQIGHKVNSKEMDAHVDLGLSSRIASDSPEYQHGDVMNVYISLENKGDDATVDIYVMAELPNCLPLFYDLTVFNLFPKPAYNSMFIPRNTVISNALIFSQAIDPSWLTGDYHWFIIIVHDDAVANFVTDYHTWISGDWIKCKVKP